MKGTRAERAVPGPQRWSYRTYVIHERATPFGRRFEVLSPQEELVFLCRAKRSDAKLVFQAGPDDGAELFRLEPKKVRQFQRSFVAVDGLTGQPFGEVRKKTYVPQKKAEWFIFDQEGTLVGLFTETAPPASLLRRIVPVDRLFQKAWALHWGQTVAGTLEPRPAIVGEKLELDLKFDARDEIDRRLALGAAVALRADAHRPGKEPVKASWTPDAEGEP